MSDVYGLTSDQAALDFVNVNISGDVALFVDPNALLNIDSAWGQRCRHLVQDFFREVLRCIRRGDHTRARQLLASLSEPNETRLGFSTGRPAGHGMGWGLAASMFQSLVNSEAVRSGLIEDLEDTALFVPGVADDVISDITTNLIREPLIGYTKVACATYGIPTKRVDSGRLWVPSTGRFTNRYVNLPVAQGRLLLVPKAIVRRSVAFDAGEYYNDYILTHLQDVHLKAGSGLVEVLKNGRRRVTKAALKEHYGTGKRVIERLTREYPEVLESYREAKRRRPSPPLSHRDLANRTGADRPDWDALLAAVVNTKAGRNDATKYHHAVEHLLTALFYPSLTMPEIEREIHDGRKRIDIAYLNEAIDGFFRWVANNYIAPRVFVECKNYSGDPANPELDQLAGRFSNRRGRFGLLVCRNFDDKELFLERCRDTADDGNGFIVPLDDDDLRHLVAARSAGGSEADKLLFDRFNGLTM